MTSEGDELYQGSSFKFLFLTQVSLFELGCWSGHHFKTWPQAFISLRVNYSLKNKGGSILVALILLSQTELATCSFSFEKLGLMGFCSSVLVSEWELESGLRSWLTVLHSVQQLMHALLQFWPSVSWGSPYLQQWIGGEKVVFPVGNLVVPALRAQETTVVWQVWWRATCCQGHPAVIHPTCFICSLQVAIVTIVTNTTKITT